MSHSVLIPPVRGRIIATLLIFFLCPTQVAYAVVLAHCKYLEIKNTINSVLTQDELINRFDSLKRSNRNIRIYEPQGVYKDQQLRILSHIQQSLPDSRPYNAEDLLNLLTAYAVTWEKNMPFQSMTPKSSSYKFIMFSSQGASGRTTLMEESEESGAEAAKACNPDPYMRRSSFLVISLTDPIYTMGIILRNGSGNKTYLICHWPPVPSLPQEEAPLSTSHSIPTPSPSPPPAFIPSDMIIHHITQQLMESSGLEPCPSK